MQKMIILVVLACALSTIADENGYFSRANISSSWMPGQVTLNDGDTMTFLYADSRSAEILLRDRNEVTHRIYLSALVMEVESPNKDYGFAWPVEHRTLVGPAIVSLETGGSAKYIAYKIVRASDNSINPVNVIVLPSDVNGDMQLIFESSNDLLTWDQVYSFTHNSTNQSSKFFRTRLIQGTGE